MLLRFPPPLMLLEYQMIAHFAEVRKVSVISHIFQLTGYMKAFSQTRIKEYISAHLGKMFPIVY